MPLEGTMEQQSTTSPSLELFVDTLLEDSGASQRVDADVLQQMRLDLLDRLDDHINAALLSALSEDKAEEFGAKIEQMTGDEAQQFLQTNIPDMNELLATELLRFRQSYLAG
jgi:hypothetical protein